MIASSRIDEQDGLLEDGDDEVRSKPRVRRTTRSTAKKSSTENEPESGLTSTLEGDPSLPNPTQTIHMKPRTRTNRLADQRESSSADISTLSPFKGHRRRSSSMTSSGLSLSTSVTTTNTLIGEDEQNDEDAHSVASADTVVDGVLEPKEHGDASTSMEKLALLVDVAAASAISPLTTPDSSTPPPSSRRSKRNVRPPKRRQNMEDDEKEIVVEKPRTRLAAGSASVAAVRRKKRARRF
jgi:hypothetical protein